ncbi:CCR4-NOT core complex subunit Not4, putative [Cordyceps militaris CM01]|uniref:CCR4-NOT core complex subunit Not4, putative n=1 Tax=Cordyceps militaris (strain CM01) TaxID=983644 RepID=G3J3N7_CORMM|nr:CCR4-NOT core complex subunit Not4, putative [Cordyceps militaris CM01]EGX95713.1 CCR4-NOT core complex subunit Not4, putative [Cordyceps militaris CM01]
MAPQDSIIDEEEEVCPLCIEEFDLSDKNFRPCPCNYQVCQFCFNNIKNNMNGLCPACRQPYNENTIKWKVVTQEEVAQFRANIQRNQKKRVQEQRQKEVMKREAERENRKNLVGVRVVQKNLVYITGLAPTVREDELLKTLRKPEFFGQYGNIQKISISNRKSADGQLHSLGIYVTFETPEEALRCISAVHCSNNGDRVLKAQHGTTKYCSAWLKNEKCNNPGCMFLHEQGDEEDSYTRQDLSSMNSIHTQRPLAGGSSSSRAASRQFSQPTPPPMAVPVSAPAPVAQAMARSLSKEESETGDSSALPSSVSWARHPVRSRRGSCATSGATSSPAVSASVPVTTEKQEPPEIPEPFTSKASSSKSKSSPSEAEQGKRRLSSTRPTPASIYMREMLENIALQCSLPLWDVDPDEDLGPPMFDLRGGEKRRAMREAQKAREAQESHADLDNHLEVPESPEDGVEAGGSRSLGGEPDGLADGHAYGQRHITPIQRSSTEGVFSPPLGSSAFGLGTSTLTPRSITPQQMGLRSQAGYTDQYPPGIGGPSNSFQGQGQGHNRQSSRFNFANDSGSSTTNIKLAANPRIMAQQSSMMPSSFQSQSSQFYANSIPAPPPGLKSTGTPPSMFTSGFGSSGYNVPKDNTNDMFQSLIGRTRGNNQTHESGKHDGLPSLADATISVDALVADEPGDLAMSFDGYNTTHSHGHPAPSRSYASTSDSITGHGHPSPEPGVRRPPPGFELRSSITSKEPIVAPVSAPTKPELLKRPTLADEEFPALGSPKVFKNASTVSPAPKLALPNTGIFQGKQAAGKKPETKNGATDGRRGSLINDTELEEKASSKAVSATPRTKSKTLRVMTPARIESPVIMSPDMSRIVPIGHRPETPASETVSDSTSIVSASVPASRPGSPPLVGSAPIRATTKSWQRKLRKDALRQDTKSITEAAVTDEADHAPVLGRKKKQKKEKPVKEKPVPTAIASEAEDSKAVPKATPQGDEAAPEKKSEPAPNKSARAPEKTVLVLPQPQPPAPTVQDSAPEEDEPTAPPQGPFTVFQDIVSSLWTARVEELSLFKLIVGSASATRQQVSDSTPGACKDIGCKCGEIQSEDLAVLEFGKPVRKQCRVDGSRMLLTPNGDCVRRLTEPEEDAFLKLQATIAQTAETAGSFTAPRHQKSSGAFSIVKGRAVPNGRPNIFPVAARPESQDPFGKLQRDEALSYINQYVLPRLNLGASGKAAAAASGSLAPLRDAAAASLNSLAPYFYGPEAAAGVGIYSAIDSSSNPRAVHDFGAPPGLTLGGNVDMVKGAGARGIGALALMTVEEAEAALAATRKDTEKLEKGLNAVIKRNKRLLIGGD